MLAGAFLRVPATLRLSKILSSGTGRLYAPYRFRIHSSAVRCRTLRSIRGTDADPGNDIIKRKYSERYLIDADVKKDILLYESTDLKTFNIIFGTTVVQQIIWTSVAVSYYDPNIWGLFQGATTLKEYIQANGPGVMLFFFALYIGPMISFAVWLLCTRSVRYIVLHKGGVNLTLITYNPIKRLSRMCLSVNDVKSNVSRKRGVPIIPLRIRGKWLYYLVDNKKGKFANELLFDNTICVPKAWTK